MRARRAPVDPARVVAGLVVAQRQELAGGSSVGTRGPSACGSGSPPARRRGGEDVVDPRAHDEVGRRRRPPTPRRASPNGSADDGEQRTELVAAAPRRSGCGTRARPACPAATGGSTKRADAPPAVDAVGEREQRGARPSCDRRARTRPSPPTWTRDGRAVRVDRERRDGRAARRRSAKRGAARRRSRARRARRRRGCGCRRTSAAGRAGERPARGGSGPAAAERRRPRGSARSAPGTGTDADDGVG